MKQILSQDTCYRLYESEGAMRRLGCGTMYSKVNATKWKRDIDTEDFSASLILAGSLDYEEADGKVTRLGKGNVFQRIPGIIHSTAPVRGSHFAEFFILFPGDAYRAILSLGIASPLPFFRLKENPAVTGSYRNVQRIITSNTSDWVQQTLLSMQNCLLQIQNMLRLTTGEDSWLARARITLQGNWNRPLPEVAEELGLGYDQFRRMFKRETGFTPGAYRIRKRVALAMQLLFDRTLTPGETARHLSYPDIYTFSKQFKQSTGVSPKEFITSGSSAVDFLAKL